MQLLRDAPGMAFCLHSTTRQLTPPWGAAAPLLQYGDANIALAANGSEHVCPFSLQYIWPAIVTDVSLHLFVVVLHSLAPVGVAVHVE